MAENHLRKRGHGLIRPIDWALHKNIKEDKFLFSFIDFIYNKYFSCNNDTVNYQEFLIENHEKF
jgi:hypothetical protein